MDTMDAELGRPVLEPPVLEASGLVKEYNTDGTVSRALAGVSLDVPAGRFLSVMGPSGSGKSTLMHILAGLDKPTEGVVEIAGIDITDLSDSRLTLLRRHQVGFIFQFFNLLPMLTAEENILLPLRLAGENIDRTWADEIIDQVGLSDRRKHRPSELSGGQQQRVAVARALASRPEIIFADEPTGNLDSRAGAEILDFMRSAVAQMGQTIVMVTHDPVAASYSDHALFLADGKIVDEMPQPTADRVLDRMKRFGD